jgi:DNA-binding response OmpR family regulator
VEKEEILNELGYLSDGPYGNRALGVMVARLRKKIKTKVGENALIETVYGFGFTLGEKLRSL